MNQTILTDALYGGIGGVVVDVGTLTFLGAVGGSSVGPEGTVAGAGFGFSLGVIVAPVSFFQGAFAGMVGGVFHGAVFCSTGIAP